MADKISLRIITADGVAWEGNASYVNLPSGGGSVGILGDHAPMLCAVSEGTVRCQVEGAEQKIRVGEGIANVAANKVTLLVAAAEAV